MDSRIFEDALGVDQAYEEMVAYLAEERERGRMRMDAQGIRPIQREIILHLAEKQHAAQLATIARTLGLEEKVVLQ